MASILPNPEPFQEFKIYGPYLSKKENRKIVVLVSNGKPSTSMSYARYLASVAEGRQLRRDEEADHLDDDKTNDNPENIQVLSLQQNKAKGRQPTMVTLVCPNCEKEFTRERRQTHLIKGGSHTCCSRICAGEYQHKRIKDASFTG